MCVYVVLCLRVEFLLKTDSGYPRDAEVTLFTVAPWQTLSIPFAVRVDLNPLKKKATSF